MDKIGIIGAGKVGCSIIIGLSMKGIDLGGVYTRTSGTVDYINEFTGKLYVNDLDSVILNSNVIFITVSDLELEFITKQIVNNSEKLPIKGKIFFHCSGALSSDELNLLSWQGAHTASFHPIQTFPDRKESWKNLENIYFGFEGSENAYEKAENFARLFNSRILKIEKKNKSLYHIAACFLSNYMVTIFYTANEMLKKAGIDDNDSIRAFTPLINKTLRNIFNIGVLEALTGPISRGDINVLIDHMKSLKIAAPEFIDLYKSLGEVTCEIALKNKSIDKHKLDSIKSMFGELNGVKE